MDIQPSNIYNENSSEGNLIGQVFRERYTIVKNLGSGGSSRVYLINDEIQNEYIYIVFL